jgi:hydroxymethylbilane synthase
MSRIVLGNCGSALALSQARAVLSELSAEWPDVHLVQRTVQTPSRDDPARSSVAELLDALERERINIALQPLEDLPASLPESLELVAVTKRLEPRLTLISKGAKTLGELPDGAVVGVRSPRDAAFLKASRRELGAIILPSDLDQALALLSAGDVNALVLPAAHLIQQGLRQYVSTLLEADTCTPAAGQGSLGLIVRQDDHLAADLAYTLQHRPSFDRVRAERSFAKALRTDIPHLVGALATVTSDGELNLFGALTDPNGTLVIQAEINGEASEAAELGSELAQDVLAQLKTRA